MVPLILRYKTQLTVLYHHILVFLPARFHHHHVTLAQTEGVTAHLNLAAGAVLDILDIAAGLGTVAGTILSLVGEGVTAGNCD